MKPHFPIRPKAGRYDEDSVTRAPRRRARALKGDLEALDSLPRSTSVHPKGEGWREGGGAAGGPAFRRFLLSRVGKPWGAVYSEALKGVDSPEALHCLIRWYVHQNTRLDDETGDVIIVGLWAGRASLASNLSNSFWVHPTTGLLCHTASAPSPSARAARAERQKAAAESLPWRLIDGGYYLRSGGIWYAAEARVAQEGDPTFSLRERMRLWGSSARVAAYRDCIDRLRLPKGADGGADLILVRTTQLSSRTLKRLGLVNRPSDGGH